jgi:hypothetical protein
MNKRLIRRLKKSSFNGTISAMEYWNIRFIEFSQNQAKLINHFRVYRVYKIYSN